MVGTFLIGCAALLLVVGCAGTRSETSKKEQGSSPQATDSEEKARCEGTQPVERPYEERWLTNNVPGCPKGGLLSGTDSNDKLDGLDGDDEIRGLGSKDQLIGGKGSDVLYGGPGNDALDDPLDGGDDVIYGGDGDDRLNAGKGEDAMYGGDGNDLLDDYDGQPDKLYCGKGKDHYRSEKIDYVDSSCEVKRPPLPTA